MDKTSYRKAEASTNTLGYVPLAAGTFITMAKKKSYTFIHAQLVNELS